MQFTPEEERVSKFVTLCHKNKSEILVEKSGNLKVVKTIAILKCLGEGQSPVVVLKKHLTLTLNLDSPLLTIAGGDSSSRKGLNHY